MALSKLEQQSPTQEPPSPSHCYTALPPQPPDENYVVLPYYSPEGRLRWCGCRMLYTGTASFFLLATLVYIFWPSDPDVKIVRMHVNRMKIHTVPIIALDMSLLITLKVRNSDVYSMDFTSLDVAVGYRGKMLGHVTSEQGHVKALGSSYVEARCSSLMGLRCCRTLCICWRTWPRELSRLTLLRKSPATSVCPSLSSL
ncbi:hypothetical protein ES319_A05G134100v1 [Gossypium barbadense]|uniref:Late embryogenesis abundant protein LEA-2 subgroup domain-containing protein n=2 Tax=Gossypium TaxID=3633 RepID=A0A5J5VNI3_GOSBA|nr:hypothetical protein ES319_A05G134100v1 [Gossypium barbadense]TYH16702.1 hypothetical protein ES288_A05G136200v1 [Gossypium darwinii]